MQRPPRPVDSWLLSSAMAGWSLLQGGLALVALAAVLVGGVIRVMPQDELRALMVVSLVLLNVSLILVNRSFDASLRVALRCSNPFLWILLAGVAVVLATALA